MFLGYYRGFSSHFIDSVQTVLDYKNICTETFLSKGESFQLLLLLLCCVGVFFVLDFYFTFSLLHYRSLRLLTFISETSFYMMIFVWTMHFCHYLITISVGLDQDKSYFTFIPGCGLNSKQPFSSCNQNCWLCDFLFLFLLFFEIQHLIQVIMQVSYFVESNSQLCNLLLCIEIS